MPEHYLTGYCRVLDSARVGEVLVEDKKVDEGDCGYGNCKFQTQCTIAKGIEELTAY